ncbi:MAG TPA: N-acetyltransferase [Anaerolineales bacterium]|nr:N-acetyltransferase [Anaerolineales bacterium]
MTLIRPARPDDSEKAAFLIRLTLGGTADLFVDRGSTMYPEQIFKALFARDSGRLSYQHSFILEEDRTPAGLLVSFPASAMTMLDLTTGSHLLSILGLAAMTRLTQRMLPMTGVREAERGEYYISNVGVHPDFQRRGYGAQLLSFAEEQARAGALKKCSLIVNQHNENAIRLYQRFRYRIIFSGEFKGPLAEVEGGYHRMVKELT